jgi:hypothetical protein
LKWLKNEGTKIETAMGRLPEEKPGKTRRGTENNSKI